MATGLEAALAPITKQKGLLTLIYQDLAQPGVRQVGKALGTVLGVGNTVLIPLRMMNEVGRAAEERTFAEIADRLAKIPEEQVVEVRPEIGVPLIEKLSATHDPDLRSLFIELLATAASSSHVEHAHPSFPSILGSLSPDEAKMLRFLKQQSLDVPLVEIRAREPSKNSYKIFADLQIDYPPDLVYPNNIALYVSNMAGLGLMEPKMGLVLEDEDQGYQALFDKVKMRIGVTDTIEFDRVQHNVYFERGVLRILPLGATLMKACMP